MSKWTKVMVVALVAVVVLGLGVGIGVALAGDSVQAKTPSFATANVAPVNNAGGWTRNLNNKSGCDCSSCDGNCGATCQGPCSQLSSQSCQKYCQNYCGDCPNAVTNSGTAREGCSGRCGR